MIDNSKTAEQIINKIFEETNKVIQMNITSMNEFGIAAVLSGLVAFLVAGYRNDFELAQEITPQYQKRIMPRVDKEVYDNSTFQLNDSYTKFRECAINHQYKSENWATEMFDDFGKMLLVMLNANATQYSKNLMVEEAQRLLDIAVKTSVEESIKEKEKKKNNTTGGKFAKIVIGVLVVLLIGGYIYKDNFHSRVYPEGLYFMQQYYDDSQEHYDCYIKVISTEDDNMSPDYFNIYLIKYIDDSGEYYPEYCYMTSSPCGYWEWKKLIGSFAVNDAGKKYGFLQKGYQRVDCYISDGKAVGFDSNFKPLDTSEDDLSAVIETIDFGTNNFIYQGTIYNKVNEANLDDDTKFYMECLEVLMNVSEE